MTNATGVRCCMECGTPLTVRKSGPPATYCSARCRAKVSHRRKKQDGRYEANKEAARAKAAAEREANARPCPYCGDPMGKRHFKQCGKDACKKRFNVDRNVAFQRRIKDETGRWPSQDFTYERTCEVCGTAWQAGTKTALYCSRGCANTVRRYTHECASCGEAFTSPSANARWCSARCQAKWGSCKIPESHPVISNSTFIPLDHPARWPWLNRTCRVYITDCRWCSKAFTTRQPLQVLCSKRCVRQEAREIREANEYNAEGSFTWTEFMAIFIKFDRRCAYCRDKVQGQPEPDHVIPLSRGGTNWISNILPSCKPCNTSKNDRTPIEWQERRAIKGMQPRWTTFDLNDPLYSHLVLRGPTRNSRSGRHSK